MLVNNGAVGAKHATEWLSLNIGEVFTGGLALYSTYKLYKKKKDGTVDTNTVIWATVGIGIKVTAGVTTSNPILLISGVADTAILISSSTEARKAFEEFLGYVTSDGAKAGYTALGTGLGAAASTTGIVTAIGTASTGTAISTLSGAAATNALLAAIGGGSLATGGLGVAGGIVILSGGSAIVGLAAGYGAYRLIKLRRAKAS